MATIKELEGKSSGGGKQFDVEKLDIIVTAYFATQFWPLFHNVPAMYSALLERLAEFNLTPSAIRSDVGDGSLGGYNVNFWLFDFRLQTKIKLDRFELHAFNATRGDVETIGSVLKSLVAAVAVAETGLKIRSYNFECGMHGGVRDTQTAEFISQFVYMKSLVGQKPVGAGVVYYYGETGSNSFRSVTIDLSLPLPGKLYIRVVGVMDGSIESGSFVSELTDRTNEALGYIGLKVAEG